jgi:WD40 repeat protein
MRSLMALMVGAAIWMGSTSIPSASNKQAGVASLNVREEFDLSTPGAAVAVTWSPRGSALAAASDYGDVLSVWDQAGHLINQIKRTGGGPTLGGSLAFVNGSSQLMFPPPETSNNSTAFAVWDVSTGTIIRTVDGPQPGDDYPLNRADHFMATPDQTLLVTATRGGKGWKGFQKNVTIYDT